MLDSLCQKMRCMKRETLQDCQSKRKVPYKKTGQEEAFARKYPDLVCKGNSQPQRPNFLQATAAALGSVIALSSVVPSAQRGKNPLAGKDASKEAGLERVDVRAPPTDVAKKYDRMALYTIPAQDSEYVSDLEKTLRRSKTRRP
jgi:hypothetical protein